MESLEVDEAEAEVIFPEHPVDRSDSEYPSSLNSSQTSPYGSFLDHKQEAPIKKRKRLSKEAVLKRIGFPKLSSTRSKATEEVEKLQKSIEELENTNKIKDTKIEELEHSTSKRIQLVPKTVGFLCLDFKDL